MSKPIHVGAPKIFVLELALQHVNSAFGDGSFGCYLVGSALQRADWRDVDVRMILSDEAFAHLFPDVDLEVGSAIWEFDPRWLLLTVSLSEHLSRVTGLPVDFQFQPQTLANKWHKGPRNALGLRFAKSTKNEAP